MNLLLFSIIVEVARITTEYKALKSLLATSPLALLVVMCLQFIAPGYRVLRP